MTDYTVITDAAGLADAVSQLAAGSGPVAVDVERASGFRYSQRAYLVQVFRRGSGRLPLRPAGRSAISRRCRRRSATRSGCCTRRARTCRRCASSDLEPATMFDTELAARLLGHARVGLGAVVEDTLGIIAGEGPLGVGLVDPPAPPVLARVRRARCRASRRRARRARRGARRAGQDRVSRPRSSARCSIARPSRRAKSPGAG